MGLTLQLFGGPFEEPKGLPSELRIPLNEKLQPIAGKPNKAPFALATFREVDGEYFYSQTIRLDRKPFFVNIVDGPAQGIQPSPEPIDFMPPIYPIYVDENNQPWTGDGKPVSVALYEKTRLKGELKFKMLAIDETPELLGQASRYPYLRDMALRFFRHPNPAIWSKQPTGDHAEIRIGHDHREAHVDRDIAPLLLEIWRWQFDTQGSCHDMNGKAYIAFTLFTDGIAFQMLLKNAGIATTREPMHCGVQIRGTANRLDEKTCNVYLSPADIGRAAEALRDRRVT